MQNQWVSRQGEDYLQLLRSDGVLLSGIDSTGSAYGALAPTPVPPSGVINVQSYGATGDSRQVTDAVSSGANIITSATANFTPADVGKVVWGVEEASGLARVGVGTVATVISATQITVTSGSFSSGYSGLFLVLGTDDSDSLIAAYQAAAALRPSANAFASQNMPTVYIPTGGYIFSKVVFYPYFSAGEGQLPLPSILGDGPLSTYFYPSPDYDFSDPNYSVGHGMLNTNFGTNNRAENQIGGFYVSGSGFSFSSGGSYAVDASGATFVHDIFVESFTEGDVGGVGAPEGANGTWSNLLTIGVGGTTGNPGIYINGGNVTLINCQGSNGYLGILIVNINQGTSFADDGGQCTLIGCYNDEGSDTPQVQFKNCSSTSAFGCAFYSGVANCLGCYVDGTSDVSFYGTTIGPYAYHADASGMLVDVGGTIRISGCRIYANGTGVALTNNGTAIDMGGNSFNGTGTPLAGSGVGPMNAVAQLTSDPSTTGFGAAQAGYMWFNTTGGLLKFWNGTVIKTVATV